MTKQTIARMNFMDLLTEEFLSTRGYGAYAYLSTVEGVNLFDQFDQQSSPVQEFIKSFVKKFR